ncbi:hypothetical protein TcasGA2_TC032481 [Tribolium castaneum]|uniref:Uncharacterized protein n=1 Tax=Tribolium castaneum TaxID=7070 RepID=A0A139WKW4_TRICA|nr:hypothetical protein TcasGA2_TC032481 [Tribolium castaneum]
MPTSRFLSKLAVKNNRLQMVQMWHLTSPHPSESEGQLAATSPAAFE